MSDNPHASHAMPYGIEEPIPIMFLDPIEFIMVITFIGFGILSDLIILGGAGAFIVVALSRYLKRGAKRGAMQHFMWSLGMQIDKNLANRFPPAWKNDFIS
mgnify:CR=1 FL=1